MRICSRSTNKVLAKIVNLWISYGCGSSKLCACGKSLCALSGLARGKQPLTQRRHVRKEMLNARTKTLYRTFYVVCLLTFNL